MRVGGPGRGHGAGAAGAVAPTTVVDETEQPPAPEPTVDAGDEVVAAEGHKSKLIDKLASGHFNDVAAIRLRINHAEAIDASGREGDLPEIPDASTHTGQGLAKAIEAYQATLPPPEADPADETVDDVVVENPTAGVEPVIEPGGEDAVPDVVVDEFIDPIVVPEETLLDQLLEATTEETAAA